jgi:hypothetical protein
MTDRISNRDLEAVCERINRVFGYQDTPLWSHRPNDDGTRQVVATVGQFYIDGAYGGVSLDRMVNEGGGVTDVFRCGHVSKRELYGRMHAFLDGIDLAMREIAAGTLEFS